MQTLSIWIKKLREEKPYLFGLLLACAGIISYIIFQIVSLGFIDGEGTLYFSIGMLIFGIPLGYFYRWVYRNNY